MPNRLGNRPETSASASPGMPAWADIAVGEGVNIVNSVLGRRSDHRRMENQKELLAYGNELDMANQKEMYDYRISQGRDAGMTAYEMFMGPASGAGGGTTGSGQTLGNNYTTLKAGQQQIRAQFFNNMLNRITDLQKTKMQADAQRDVAETQFKGTQYSADTQRAIAAGRLGFDKDVYYNTTAPEAAARMGLTTQQTLKAANEVVTSEKEFVKLMKVASMSSENILATLTAIGLPYDVLEPNQAKKLTKKDREKATSAILSLLSNSRKEMSGMTAFFRGLVEGYTGRLKPIEEWFKSDEKLGNQEIGKSNMDALPNWINQ